MARRDLSPRQRLDPDQRRDAILAAAASAFAEAPYEQVTVAAVAERAGASEALVYRYFAGKAELYAQLVRLAVDDLADQQAAALAALPSGVAVRERLKVAAVIYLDHIASHPTAWANPLQRPGSEPEDVLEFRRQARVAYVERLRRLLSPRLDRRHEYALWGYFGFLDGACLHWVEQGCPESDRWPLIEAALGSLEGALGDWDA